MTRRISAVAVCCSSASVSSRFRASSSWKRRTFSIAITAWSAKVRSSASSTSVKGPTVGRATLMPPMPRVPFSNGMTAKHRCPVATAVARLASLPEGSVWASAMLSICPVRTATL